MNYRNRRLLDLAHLVHECQGCGKYVTEGCEPAHANWSEFGKGMSIKAHDCYHAALCHTCHAWLDQGSESRAVKQMFWNNAYQRTMLLYWKSGWLSVHGSDVERRR